MQRLTKDRFVQAMSKANPAAFAVEDGETFLVETRDCWGGYIGRDGIKPPDIPVLNPATGPIEVKGAQPGETLAVTILEIKPAAWGLIGGGGKDSSTIGGGQDACSVIELEGGFATYPCGRKFPLDPMLGVLGVAPAGDSVPTTTPGDHGGNLDTVDICVGATVYLPVSAPGALLALGDVHALQGDGEVGGTGIECDAEVTLTVRRVKETLWPLPLIVREDKLMLLASAETLDEAVWKAVAEMAGLLSKLTGLSDQLARRMLSTLGEVRISQIVNPKKTCRAIVPKAVIGEGWPF